MGIRGDLAPTDALNAIFVYFFHLIYIFSTFIFIFTFGGDARGGVTGIVELRDRGLKAWQNIT